MVEDLEKRVKEMIVERCFLTISPHQIENDASLTEAIGLDSVQVLEVVVGLEEVFGITFEDADFDIENFASVSAIAAYVRQADAGGQ